MVAWKFRRDSKSRKSLAAGVEARFVMQCVILAGGLGTRMRPQTVTTPKTLLPVGSTPFAHYQLSWLAGHGVRHVVYSIAVLGEQVRDFVGDGQPWGLEVSYVEDGDQLAGTAGALRRVFDTGVLAEWFLVLYGDSFLPVDFRGVATAFLGQDRPALMTVYRNQGKYDTGNVRYNSGVVRLYQKARKGESAPSGMDYIDYGLSALHRDLIDERIPAGQIADLADLYHRLSLEGRLAGLEVHQRFYEIGSPAGMSDFETWASEHPIDTWAGP
jgi:NDP-sugar pyrophosphorylase family protein